MVKVYELMNKGIDPVQYCLDKIEELEGATETLDAGAGESSVEGDGASLDVDDDI